MQDNASIKILVVEDEPALRDLYVEILKQAGFNITSASDGQEAFDLMHTGGYDLVLLDIILPKIDGLSILEKLFNESKPVTPNKHIVVLSNLGQDEAISKALTLGAHGYLLKSDYTPGQIVDQVNHYLHEEPLPSAISPADPPIEIA